MSATSEAILEHDLNIREATQSSADQSSSISMSRRRMTLPSIHGREDPIFKCAQTPNPDPAHGAAFIFVHGLGDTAEGLEAVADQFQRSSKLPYMHWIIPNASINHDAMTTAWYRPSSFSPFPSDRPELEDPEDEDGMLLSIAYIESLIDACIKKGIPAQRIVLGGFSQGCALSLLLDLTSKKYAGRLAGIAGLMGYVPLGKRLQDLRAHAGLPPTHGEVPVFLARGKRDILIPKRVWTQSLKALDSMGLHEGAMVVNEYDIGHSLNGPVLQDLCQWLKRVVPDLDLQEQIERITEQNATGAESTDALEHCSAGIARLSNEVRDTVATLPAHDRQIYSDAIKALSSKLQTVKTQQSRKQKFSFKNSAFKLPKNESAVSIHDAADLASQRQAKLYNDSEESSMATTPINLTSPPPERAEGASVADRQGEYVLATHETLAADIQSSVLDFSGSTLPTFRLRNITNSVIFVPQVTGPIYLEGISGSIIVAGCHQFRMHNSSKSEVYLHCASRPIIEDCHSIHFAPLPEMFAAGKTEIDNRWDQIDDFKWLRAEHSPNWSVLEANEQRGAGFWKKVKELRSHAQLSQSLATLGLP
ncbi:hypothetical protein AMS68_006071 [Peltaster fructicola]|uniref:C-CAP/cofactor C-like domain-containing protein n=1 Tax=Peltaster fructicola TaxID=286661 RepID=A0A6H0Y0M1_9PEZI|nr:hypothetical protein AMS68_006071 [Peltaster fructicola]